MNLFKATLKGADLASATTITPGVDGDRFDVTGTTTVTAINTNGRGVGSRMLLRFTGALQLTHSSNLVLRGGANYTTTAGDELLFEVIGTNQVRQVVLANNAAPPSAGTGGVVQVVALTDLSDSALIGVRGHSQTEVADVANPTSNSDWTAAIAGLAAYTRAFVQGAIAHADSVFKGALWFWLQSGGTPPAVEVIKGAVLNLAASGAVIYNGATITPGDSVSTIQAALRGNGEGDVIVSGTSTPATGGPTDDLLQGKTIVSSVGVTNASNIIDGSDTTYAVMAGGNTNGVVIDMGANQTFTSFKIKWVASGGTAIVTVSDTATRFSGTNYNVGVAGYQSSPTVSTFNTNLPQSLRYVRIWPDNGGNVTVYYVKGFNSGATGTPGSIDIDIAYPASVDPGSPTVTGGTLSTAVARGKADDTEAVVTQL